MSRFVIEARQMNLDPGVHTASTSGSIGGFHPLRPGSCPRTIVSIWLDSDMPIFATRNERSSCFMVDCLMRLCIGIRVIECYGLRRNKLSRNQDRTKMPNIYGEEDRWLCLDNGTRALMGLCFEALHVFRVQGSFKWRNETFHDLLDP